MKSLSLSRPHLLIMVGIPGSGKSFFAEKFAVTFGAPYVNYGKIMEIASQNRSVTDVYAGYLLKEIFKTNHTIVFDGPSDSRGERAALKDLASRAGYSCLFIWVQTDTTTAKSRFLKTNRSNGYTSTPDQYDALIKKFSPPDPKEHSTVVISGKHTYATQAKVVLKNLTLTKQVARVETVHQPKTLSTGKRNIIVR